MGERSVPRHPTLGTPVPRPDAVEHVSDVVYSWQDDGIHVTCSCGEWWHEAGFDLTIEDLTQAFARHQAQVAPDDPQ